MKIRKLSRKSKRTPRVIYADNAPRIADAAIFVDPQTGKTERAYLSEGIRGTNNQSYPGCDFGAPNYAPPSNSQRRRYCHIAHSINNYYRVGYEYYTGHKYSVNEVIQRGGGNCCDVSRLVNKIATDTLECSSTCGGAITDTYYVICDIVYKGNTYSHCYNELLVDGVWLTFDGVSQLLYRNCRQIFGEFKGAITRLPGSTSAPCS